MLGVMITFIAVTLLSKKPDCIKKASLLAEQLQLPMVSFSNPESRWLLVVTEKGLELQCPSIAHWGSLYVDFLGGKLAYRVRDGYSNEPLVRAVGYKKGTPLSVIDATAGLGRDAFVLARAGCNVLLLERSPILAALLADGMERASELFLYWKLQIADAELYLGECKSTNQPDVVYLDPLFPPRKKTALVKKDMQAIQALSPESSDDNALLEAALNCARNRVVVKRPSYAEPFAGRQPHAVIQQGKCRFEIYRV
jgi:16S rRNA (guanine1516-N2)-methyltransferase